MRRRTFITLLGGTVVWPMVTRAQQGERVRLIGILNILGKDDPEAKVRLIILQEALKQLGWEPAAISRSKAVRSVAMSIAFAVTPQSLPRSDPT
jgi:hypothetical protein